MADGYISEIVNIMGFSCKEKLTKFTAEESREGKSVYNYIRNDLTIRIERHTVQVNLI